MSEIISTIVEICKQNPSHIAIKYKDKSVNYGELDIQSSRLAQYFQQLGLKKGDHIGVILERSIDLIVTIVAIMRSGAVYVHIDPASPIERIRNIIEDSDLKAVIVSDTIPCQALCNTIIKVYSSSFSSLSSMLTEEKPKINGNDAAYIIYPSGTTGAAKGVVISHDNLSALFEATSNKALFSLTSEDRWSFFSSHAFDFSIWEIFGALYYGALLVIVPTTLTKDPAAFYQFMIAEKITIFSNTPSFFYQIIDSAITDQLSQCSLRYIIFGGEALNFGLLKPWCNKYGLDNIKLINMYGITETTVHTTYHRITEEDLCQHKSIIGKPLENAEIYLLDENKNTIALGEMGEWMKKYGESVYGTRGGPIDPHSWGVTTIKGSKVYIHLMGDSDENLLLNDFGKKIKKAYLFDDQTPVIYKQNEFGISIKVPAAKRKPIDTIVVMEY